MLLHEWATSIEIKPRSHRKPVRRYDEVCEVTKCSILPPSLIPKFPKSTCTSPSAAVVYRLRRLNCLPSDEPSASFPPSCKKNLDNDLMFYSIQKSQVPCRILRLVVGRWHACLEWPTAVD